MCFRYFFIAIIFEKRVYVFIDRYKFHAIYYFEIDKLIIVNNQLKAILYFKIQRIIKNVNVLFDVEIECFETLKATFARIVYLRKKK